MDVRVVAATNRDLQTLIEEGKFRQDVWFRLNVVHIRLPPLRERRSDIRLLANHFLRLFNSRYERNVRLAADGLKALEEHAWPGNVRQLQHVLERLVILIPVEVLEADAVADALQCGAQTCVPYRHSWRHVWLVRRPFRWAVGCRQACRHSTLKAFATWLSMPTFPNPWRTRLSDKPFAVCRPRHYPRRPFKIRSPRWLYTSNHENSSPIASVPLSTAKIGRP